MGQFSVEISCVAGSVLSGNQQSAQDDLTRGRHWTRTPLRHGAHHWTPQGRRSPRPLLPQRPRWRRRQRRPIISAVGHNFRRILAWLRPLLCCSCVGQTWPVKPRSIRFLTDDHLSTRRLCSDNRDRLSREARAGSCGSKSEATFSFI